ncbi:general stress protein [Saccharothrix luteola]|uniref:general stress protein n=1 Tax=Saccharothrix luteola TaxID=2893018 RepID=UPI003558A68E
MVTVTSSFSGQNRPGVPPRLPTPPTGWPIGSYGTYEEAQRAVDFLADDDFPVQEVTIVGVDLMLVERVTGRLTWGRVLGTGAASGAWFGLFVGVLLSLFNTTPGSSLGPIVAGLVVGIAFGLIFAAVGYGSARGKRDFQSASQLVAGRYDVLCQPRSAERGRDLLAKLAMRPSDAGKSGQD